MNRRLKYKILRSLFILAAITAVIGIASLWLAFRYFERTPGEAMRHAERRLIGHPKLEFFILPVFTMLRPHIERPVHGPLPKLGKGQQAQTLPEQEYNDQGHPLSVSVQKLSVPYTNHLDVLSVASEVEIFQAISQARPGQTIEIAPGTYNIQKKIRVQSGGLPTRPIIVRANFPGSVTINFATVEGFNISAPYWIFENLNIVGKCQHHGECEHAYHIVGKAKNIVIRNNHIEDFNAHIKVNGQNDNWPDHGLIEHNTLTNSQPRNTANPVTPIDIVGASNWQVTDNVISRFIKTGGNQTSYGVFMKGAGANGQILRNLVVCTDKDISQPGGSVGISYGGGGTSPISLCRDKRCITEHTGGVLANNVIAHCDDFGIYVNKSNQTRVARNTLINTYGIDVRFPSASAIVEGNLLDGMVRAREGSAMEARANKVVTMDKIFSAPMQLDLRWKSDLSPVAATAEIVTDFCGVVRGDPSLPGAFAQGLPCQK